MPGSEDLVTHVHDQLVVVIGAGAAGLVAAWECARVGLKVTVLDAAERLGGSLAPLEIDGMTVDGAHADFAPGDPAVGTVLSLLGCDDTEPVTEPRIALSAGGPAPLEGLLGIPTNPWAVDVRRVVGWSGTWRGYLDRIRPPMTIGREPSLGVLVRSRLGERIADRLVAPLAAVRWETPLDDLDADAVLPGISTALTRTGSLTAAAAQLGAGHAPARRAVRKGFGPFVTALETHLLDLGAELRTSHAVTTIAHAEGRWRVSSEGDEIVADAVILAAGPAQTRRLFAHVLPDVEVVGPVDEVDVVTLVIDAPAQQRPQAMAFPRGSDVLSAADVTAGTAGAEPDRRVIRVVLAAADRDDASVAATAMTSAAELLGVPATAARMRGFARSRRVTAGTGRRVGDAARVEAARDALRAHAGLYAVGGWIAGGDLSEEIADAVRTAEGVRHTLLWGPQPGRGTP
ncbi:FAD-dependent oxidoreductase [Microbacterium sp.]|uniref:protoporphyrinogen/coproporphyrinogen oxidase n=1 Tax=Microbacterium sp. TaxID=51671 RepID=UPI0025D75B56|nr:FAD-dependent oxidoreductase [Microbacterium sp.]